MRLGLVVEGGGMKCAYSAGILDRFLDDDIDFDYCIGVSAGSANLASYLAGQRGRNLRFYTEHIAEPLYFGARAFLRSGEIFNLDYIYSALSNSDGGDPLDFDAVRANPARFAAVATSAVTGRPQYFYKEEMKKDDYIHIKASCALPVACRPRFIDGTPYYDGGVADSIPVKRALWDGCDRLVVILSKPRDFVKPPEGHRRAYHAICRRYPAIVRAIDRRHEMYNGQMRYLDSLEAEGRAFVFAPSKHLPMDTYAMDADGNRALYDLGLEDYDSVRTGLRDFVGE